MERGFVRKLPALVVAAGLLVALTGCGGSPASNLANCVPAVDSGKASAQVAATGDFGKDPKGTFPTPLITKGNQVTQLDAGKGLPLYPGQIADFQITVYNAETGDVLTASGYDKTQPVRRTVGDTKTDGIGALLQCATVDSRVAATTTVKDLFGDKDLSQYGLTAKSTLVVVLDVQRGFLGKANGIDQLPQGGFPAIALAPDGQPGLTIPHTDPPKDLKIEVLKAGGGAVVKKGDSVVVHYTGVLWDGTTPFDSSWDKGTPATFVAEDMTASKDGSGLVSGFAKALIGQKVGSQVVVIIPPKDGYPSGKAPDSIPDGSTMVFVFDILGIE
jgi:hypothetical protein